MLTGGNIKKSSLSNDFNDVSGQETSTKYKDIPSTRTIHNSIIITAEKLRVDS